jgi:hypothetical protein
MLRRSFRHRHDHNGKRKTPSTRQRLTSNKTSLRGRQSDVPKRTTTRSAPISINTKPIKEEYSRHILLIPKTKRLPQTNLLLPLRSFLLLSLFA